MKNLNQQVKCNIARFPEDFMFRLTREEIESVKSQFVISRENNFFEGQGGGRRTLPYAFTEQGSYMLAIRSWSGFVYRKWSWKKRFFDDAVVNDFIQQYPPLRIKPNADCHDRLIVLDYGLSTEQAYHCGTSSKDAGKKLCAINVILETSMIHPVIDKLLLASDKQI